MVRLTGPQLAPVEQPESGTNARAYRLQHAKTRAFLAVFDVLHDRTEAAEAVGKRDTDVLGDMAGTEEADLLNFLVLTTEYTRSAERVARCYLLNLGAAMKREGVLLADA